MSSSGISFSFGTTAVPTKDFNPAASPFPSSQVNLTPELIAMIVDAYMDSYADSLADLSESAPPWYPANWEEMSDEEFEEAIDHSFEPTIVSRVPVLPLLCTSKAICKIALLRLYEVIVITDEKPEGTGSQLRNFLSKPNISSYRHIKTLTIKDRGWSTRDMEEAQTGGMGYDWIKEEAYSLVDRISAEMVVSGKDLQYFWASQGVFRLNACEFWQELVQILNPAVCVKSLKDTIKYEPGMREARGLRPTLFKSSITSLKEIAGESGLYNARKGTGIGMEIRWTAGEEDLEANSWTVCLENIRRILVKLPNLRIRVVPGTENCHIFCKENAKARPLHPRIVLEGWCEEGACGHDMNEFEEALVDCLTFDEATTGTTLMTKILEWRARLGFGPMHTDVMVSHKIHQQQIFQLFEEVDVTTPDARPPFRKTKNTPWHSWWTEADLGKGSDQKTSAGGGPGGGGRNAGGAAHPMWLSSGMYEDSESSDSE